MRAPHERTEGKADPSRSPAAGRKQPPASGHSMNEELHWQPMASRDLDLDREQPPHLRISGVGLRSRGVGYAAQAIRESTPRDRRPKTAWPWV